MTYAVNLIIFKTIGISLKSQENPVEEISQTCKLLTGTRIIDH